MNEKRYNHLRKIKCLIINTFSNFLNAFRYPAKKTSPKTIKPPRVILTQIASIFIFFLSLVRDTSSSIKDRRLTKEKVSDSKG